MGRISRYVGETALRSNSAHDDETMTNAADTEAFRAERRAVLRNMALGVAVSVAVILAGKFVYPPAVPDSDAVPDRLTCYWPWLALMAAPLVIGISYLARYRFRSPEAIDGGDSDDPRYRHARAYLQNTLEQTVLAVMVHLALLATLPYDWLNLVPVMVLWWVFARIVFRLAYAHGAAARAFGFAATYYPTVLGLLAVPVLELSRALG